MTAEQWLELLLSDERMLGFDQGFKMLYVPWATLESANVAFLSLNPGRAPNSAEVRIVSDERGNSYRIERATTLSPITEQFLAMAEFLDQAPDAILTGVVAPFRSDDWEGLARTQREGALALGRKFWEGPLRRSSLGLIIACSQLAASMACSITGAELEEEIPSGWGDLTLKRFRTEDGRAVVHLPHLSRFRLFGRPESDEPLRRIFDVRKPRTLPVQNIGTHRQASVRHRSASTQSLSDDTLDAIASLPRATATLFSSLRDHPDYDCQALRMQMTVSFRGIKVGGLNRRSNEWYISKVFARNFGGPALLEKHGFRHVYKNEAHDYWAIRGQDAVLNFSAAIAEMTGVDLSATTRWSNEQPSGVDRKPAQ